MLAAPYPPSATNTPFSPTNPCSRNQTRPREASDDWPPVGATTRPISHAATPADFVWSWAAAYVETGTRRLVELGFLDAAVAERARSDWEAAEADPSSLMITPLVLEIVGRKSA